MRSAATCFGENGRMINYTERLTLLMQDVVARVPALSFIGMADVVFARSGRSNAEGAFATCHCHASCQRAGYYFWRDRASRHHAALRVVRPKSPVVTLGTRRSIHALVRAAAHAISHSIGRARRFYPGADPWIAKLDTVCTSCIHIDPLSRDPPHRARRRHVFRQLPRSAILRAGSRDGACISAPASPASTISGDDFPTLESKHGGIVSTSFRTYPSFPQRYIGRLGNVPCEADTEGVNIEPLRPPQTPTKYTQDDLHIRQFTKDASKRLIRKGAFRRPNSTPAPWRGDQ